VPVWELACPDCGHRFRSLVMAGSREPAVWVCSACGGRAATPTAIHESDPFTGNGGRTGGGGSCGCGCG
jgi:hypothetical protein